jgi:hypothetical protein
VGGGGADFRVARSRINARLYTADSAREGERWGKEKALAGGAWTVEAVCTKYAA